MRLLSSIKFDILFQFRHGFYYACALVCAIYIGVIRYVPVNIKSTLVTLMIFSDTSVLGFFFIGGIILLEKDQNTLECLFVTPLRVNEYFASKVVSLTMLSLLISFIIVTASFGASFNPLMLFIGVLSGSVFFTLVGIALSACVKSVNQYIMEASLAMIIFFLPLLSYLNVVKSPLFYIFPTTASLVLIESAFKAHPLSEVLLVMLIFVLWIIIAYKWAGRLFYKHIILKVGGK